MPRRQRPERTCADVCRACVLALQPSPFAATAAARSNQPQPQVRQLQACANRQLEAAAARAEIAAALSHQGLRRASACVRRRLLQQLQACAPLPLAAAVATLGIEIKVKFPPLHLSHVLDPQRPQARREAPQLPAPLELRPQARRASHASPVTLRKLLAKCQPCLLLPAWGVRRA
jgi:hypothetical protein